MGCGVRTASFLKRATSETVPMADGVSMDVKIMILSPRPEVKGREQCGTLGPDKLQESVDHRIRSAFHATQELYELCTMMRSPRRIPVFANWLSNCCFCQHGSPPPPVTLRFSADHNL